MLAELELPSGRVMLVEGEAAAGPQDVGMSGAVRLREVRETITELAEALVEPLRALAAEEVELELSLGVELATGRLIAFMAAGKVESGLKVRVSWRRGR